MSINKRPDGTWRARWRETPGGPQKAKHFAKKSDAERFLLEVEHSLLRGTYIDPSAGKVRLDQFAREWAGRQPWRQSSRDRMMLVIEKHIIPRFGARELRSIRTSDVQAWVGTLVVGKFAPSTVESYYRVLAAVMRAAVVDRLVVETPCQNVKLPRRDATTSALTPLTSDQVHDLAAAVPVHLRGLVLATAGLGLRQGEACGLTVDRIDFLRRKVVIDRQLVTPNKGEAAHGPTKTPASVRSLPLADSVGEALAEHIRQFPPGASGLLFTTPAGKPASRHYWDAAFKRAATALGLDVTPHDLRHHAASLLISAGCSVKAVQNFLGHATAAETLDTYGHLWPDDEDRIRSSIDRLGRRATTELAAVRTD